MRIVVDAMGGDYAPRVTVEGAVRASEEYGLEVLLVGVETLIKKEIDRLGRTNARVTVISAPDSIGMGEGILSFRKKTRSSILVGTQLVKDRVAEAFVSAGNTAAVVYISRQVLGSLRGIDKPALALLVPNPQGLTLLIDVGANANCTARDLEQFAVMGGVFMETILGIKNPRIGLMNIGEEKAKGNLLTKEVFGLLRSSPLNFIGNVEGKDIYSGKADVVVSDGFTGNVALKVSEGVVESLLLTARHELTKNILARLGIFLMKRNLRKIYKKFNYAEYGGAHLMGLNGICIIGHGRSNALAVKNAVRMARDSVINKIQERIQVEIAKAFRPAEEMNI